MSNSEAVAQGMSRGSEVLSCLGGHTARKRFRMVHPSLQIKSGFKWERNQELDALDSVSALRISVRRLLLSHSSAKLQIREDGAQA